MPGLKCAVLILTTRLAPRSPGRARATGASVLGHGFPAPTCPPRCAVDARSASSARNLASAGGLAFEFAAAVPVWPEAPPAPGHMAILPSAVGPEPIVRLQAGGLKVGEVLCGRGRSSPATSTTLDPV